MFRKLTKPEMMPSDIVIKAVGKLVVENLEKLIKRQKKGDCRTKKISVVEEDHRICKILKPKMNQSNHPLPQP